jgi:hypothetical protein
MIQEFKIYEKLFEEIDKKTFIKLDIYVIGGAALLYREIKPATKDIDIVVRSEEEIRELSRILYSMNFKDFFGGKGYENFEISEDETFYSGVISYCYYSIFYSAKAMLFKHEDIITTIE